MMDHRYPYTYAADFVRSFSECDSGGVRISRSEASQIISGVAAALNLDPQKLAEKLADYAKENEPEITRRSVSRLMQAIG
jgi:predicted protein tyrosine phosphatase